MLKQIAFLFLSIIYSRSFDHLLEGGSSQKVNEQSFNEKKQIHRKILLMIWDSSREEVVSDLMKWKKVSSSLPLDVVPLHYERNEHNRITERILPKAFPAYIFIEEEHYAYELIPENSELQEILEFAAGGYKQYPREHIPHKYDPKKKFKKSWPKLLALVFFLSLTFIGMILCLIYKNTIDDEDDNRTRRKYKID